MIGLFFEVDPLPGHKDQYFELAARLRPELNKNPGLMFIDRFKSLDRPNIILSHSWWATEDDLIAWRQHGAHGAIQRAGRDRHFKDYRIRIGRLSTELYNLSSRRRICVAYLDDEPAPRAGGERFKSVFRDGKYLILSGMPFAGASPATKQRIFDVMRDYTMYDRAEAPQHYPPVERR
jgi:heme-degrading monooxygenase HmoA